MNIDHYKLSDDFQLDTTQKYNMLLLEKGNIAVRIDGRRYHFVAPCLVALKENMQVEAIDAALLQARIISFDVSFLNVNITFDLINSGQYESEYENYGFIPLNIFYDPPVTLALCKDSIDRLEDLYDQFDRAIVRQTDGRWSCRARLYLNYALELANQLYTEQRDNVQAVFDPKNPNAWVALIREKIHRDYAKKISLQTLAQEIHINKTTVEKYFKSIAGCPVTEYIIRYRIKCACYTLSTTDITLRELAGECGFSSEAYFIRQFKARMEQTPTEYRRRILAQRKREFAQKRLYGDKTE